MRRPTSYDDSAAGRTVEGVRLGYDLENFKTITDKIDQEIATTIEAGERDVSGLFGDGISLALGVQCEEQLRVQLYTSNEIIRTTLGYYKSGPHWQTTISQLDNPDNPPVPTLVLAARGNKKVVVTLGILELGGRFIDLRRLVVLNSESAMSRRRAALGDEVPADLEAFQNWLKTKTEGLLTFAVPKKGPSNVLNQPCVIPNLALLENIARRMSGIAYQSLEPVKTVDGYHGMVTSLQFDASYNNEGLKTSYRQIACEPWKYTLLLGAHLLTDSSAQSVDSESSSSTFGLTSVTEGSGAADCRQTTVTVAGGTSLSTSLYKMIVDLVLAKDLSWSSSVQSQLYTHGKIYPLGSEKSVLTQAAYVMYFGGKPDPTRLGLTWFEYGGVDTKGLSDDITSRWPDTIGNTIEFDGLFLNLFTRFKAGLRDGGKVEIRKVTEAMMPYLEIGKESEVDWVARQIATEWGWKGLQLTDSPLTIEPLLFRVDDNIIVMAKVNGEWALVADGRSGPGNDAVKLKFFPNQVENMEKAIDLLCSSFPEMYGKANGLKESYNPGLFAYDLKLQSMLAKVDESLCSDFWFWWGARCREANEPSNYRSEYNELLGSFSDWLENQIEVEKARYMVGKELGQKETCLETSKDSSNVRTEALALAKEFADLCKVTREGWQDAIARGLYSIPESTFKNKLSQELQTFQKDVYGLSGHLLTRGALLALDSYLMLNPQGDRIVSAEASKIGSRTIMGVAAIVAYFDAIAGEIIRKTSSLLRNPNNVLQQVKSGVFAVVSKEGVPVGEIQAILLGLDIGKTTIDSNKATDARILLIESKYGIVNDAYILDLFSKFSSILLREQVKSDRYEGTPVSDVPFMNGEVSVVSSETGIFVNILKPPQVMTPADLADQIHGLWTSNPKASEKEKATYGTAWALLTNAIQVSKALRELAATDPKRYISGRLAHVLDFYGILTLDALRKIITEDPGPTLGDVDWQQVYVLFTWWNSLFVQTPDVFNDNFDLNVGAFEPIGLHDNETSEISAWLAALMHNNTVGDAAKETALNSVALDVLDPVMLASDWPYPPYQIAEWRFVGMGTQDWYSIGSETTMTGEAQFGAVAVKQEVTITCDMGIDKIQLYLSDLGDIYNKTVNFNIEVFKNGYEAVGTTRLTQEGMVDVALDRQITVTAGDKLTVIIPVQNATGQVWLCDRGATGSVEQGRASGFSIANSFFGTHVVYMALHDAQKASVIGWQKVGTRFESAADTSTDVLIGDGENYLDTYFGNHPNDRLPRTWIAATSFNSTDNSTSVQFKEYEFRQTQVYGEIPDKAYTNAPIYVYGNSLPIDLLLTSLQLSDQRQVKEITTDELVQIVLQRKPGIIVYLSNQIPAQIVSIGDDGYPEIQSWLRRGNQIISAGVLPFEYVVQGIDSVSTYDYLFYAEKSSPGIERISQAYVTSRSGASSSIQFRTYQGIGNVTYTMKLGGQTTDDFVQFTGYKPSDDGSITFVFAMALANVNCTSTYYQSMDVSVDGMILFSRFTPDQLRYSKNGNAGSKVFYDYEVEDTHGNRLFMQHVQDVTQTDGSVDADFLCYLTVREPLAKGNHIIELRDRSDNGFEYGQEIRVLDLNNIVAWEQQYRSTTFREIQSQYQGVPETGAGVFLVTGKDVVVSAGSLGRESFAIGSCINVEPTQTEYAVSLSKACPFKTYGREPEQSIRRVHVSHRCGPLHDARRRPH